MSDCFSGDETQDAGGGHCSGHPRDVAAAGEDPGQGKRHGPRDVRSGQTGPFSPNASPVTTALGGVPGRLYDSGHGPGILLVPGAAPDGVEEVRVSNVARALARSGRMVFIPEMELYEERFVIEDLERIVKASEGLAERSGGPVTMMGFSFGGSFALMAATDTRLEGRLAGVATLGAFFDLVG